jgi:hypothetical protein
MPIIKAELHVLNIPTRKHYNMDEPYEYPLISTATVTMMATPVSPH